MAQHGELEDQKSERGRKVSDDVTSLDSWSELNEKETRNGFDGNETTTRISGVILSPRNLRVIEEPPQSKLSRVKLLKSDPGQAHSSRSHKFFQVPSFSDPHGRQTYILEKIKKKPVFHQHRHRSVEQLTEKDIHKHDESSDEGNKNIESCNSVRLDHSVNTNTEDTMTSMRRTHSEDSLSSRQNCGCTDCLDGRRGQQPHSVPWDAVSKPPYIKHNRHLFPMERTHLNGSSFSSDVEQSEKVKNKIMSVWNNVKYGWTLKTKTNFEKDSPIFILGRCYHRRPDDVEPMPGRPLSSSHCMEQFKLDFQSRLWFTYRRDFQALPHTKLTTDCGWGCMLRSSQMMLAQAFITHFVGREWRVHSQTPDQEKFYRQIIKWFGDSLSDQCPFSVHRLAEIGKKFGKQPGEWYGPSSVAYIVRDALSKASLSQPVLKDLCVYVAQDCTVYKEDVIKLCTSRPRNLTNSQEDRPGTSSSAEMHSGTESLSVTETKETSPVDCDPEWKQSVIILIPVRLGGEEFNPIYSTCVKNLMAQESCIGMIGGKPKHSLYFIGWQEDKLIYLDPHFCQDFVDTLRRDFRIESFHCFSPRKVSITKMDPSATLGFYCRNREDFNRFVEHTEQMATPNKGSGVYPMFVFHEGQRADLDVHELSLSSEKSLKVRHVSLDKNGRVRSTTVDSEEFVVL